MTGDSALLTFKLGGGSGTPINVNSDLHFAKGLQWKNIDMRAIGGGTVETFTNELFDVRSKNDSELKPNLGPHSSTNSHVIRDEEFRYAVEHSQDPFYDRIFDESHVALVFMNLNDLYDPEGGKFVGADPAVMKAF